MKTERETPQFTHDDVIDWHIFLNDDKAIAAAVAALSEGET